MKSRLLLSTLALVGAGMIVNMASASADEDQRFAGVVAEKTARSASYERVSLNLVPVADEVTISYTAVQPAPAYSADWVCPYLVLTNESDAPFSYEVVGGGYSPFVPLTLWPDPNTPPMLDVGQAVRIDTTPAAGLRMTIFIDNGAAASLTFDGSC